MKPPNIRLIISFFIFLSIFYCCVQKGTPFSFTTPEGEEVSLVIPPGFEDQHTASPWKKLDKDLKNYFSAYVCNADNPEEIMELYFNLREYSDINTKKWQRKPENRELYDYIEYPDSNFICVLQVEYISDPYILSLGINNGVDIHYAIMYLQKNFLDIQLYFPHDSLITERAKTVMNDIVKSIKIKKK
ncbi:hypothetical protein [uncultured Coprobacter sp.]|uniref:hypothetical protein n=2 Tax=uncultured Coprobacter sp. TaxID=1720550 RepID=UPI002618C323|nr:hypothetical protein [uncultured Coprobacter sp.]